jgi:hypothetical protein
MWDASNFATRNWNYNLIFSSSNYVTLMISVYVFTWDLKESDILIWLMFCEYKKCQLHGFLANNLLLVAFTLQGYKDGVTKCLELMLCSYRFYSAWNVCLKTVIFFNHRVRVKFWTHVCNVYQIGVVLDYGERGRIVDPWSSKQTSSSHCHAHSPVQVVGHAVLCHSKDSCVLEHFHRSEGWHGAHSLVCKIKTVIC